MDLEKLTRKAGLDAMQSFKGLCLDCIKLGVDETGEFRKCAGHKTTAEASGPGKKWRQKMSSSAFG